MLRNWTSDPVVQCFRLALSTGLNRGNVSHPLTSRWEHPVSVMLRSLVFFRLLDDRQNPKKH
jgi:hypothetical protein